MDSNKEFNKWKKSLQENAKLQKDLTEDASKYLKAVKDIGEAEKNINFIKEQNKLLEKEISDLKNNTLGLSKQEISDNKQKAKALKKILKSNKANLKVQEDATKELATQVGSVNKLALGWNSIQKGLKATPGLIKSGYGKLKSTGIFEVDKAIRDSGKSMNIVKANSDGFADNINTASKTTYDWGIQTKDLAKAQQSYSEEIGRSVILSEEGLVAIGEMAKGTGLGAEGAAMMASEMDKFGMSVTGSRDLVEETVQTAAKMGVNSDKAVKNLQKNLRLAQRFTFKGGVAGLAKMANEAARLKLDMDGISGLAEKVFRPEGAVEMAAKLQVMGGEFAKLGDPMQLMFKARNDFAGFAKDIGKATAEFVSYNKETNSFEIQGGLAADRMREISNTTGIAVEKLQEMAVQQKKIERFGSMVSSSIVDDEDRELVASLAQINKDGEAVVRLGTNDPLKISELNDAILDDYKNQKETLADRAKEGETFDEVIKNMGDIFKSTLLPFARGLQSGLEKPLKDFMTMLKDKEVFKKIEDFGKTAADIIGTVGGFMIDNPLITAISTLGLSLLGSAIKWYANGVQLGMGFNTVASAGGGVASAGGGIASKGGKMLKFAKGIGGAGAGVLSAGISGYDEYTTNKENGMDTGENVGRTGVRALASGGGAWGGAALGATIGTMVFPGVGTAIGGLIGGIAGGLAGDKIGDASGDVIFGDTKQKATQVKDGVIQFHGNDKFMNVDDNTMIAGTNVNGNKDLAKAITGGGNSSVDGKMLHKFNDLNININIKSDSSWLDTIGDGLSNDREFIRDITTKIQEEVRMAIGGGKLNPNPL